MTHDEICDRLQLMLNELRDFPLQWPEAYAMFAVSYRGRENGETFTLVLGIKEGMDNEGADE